MPRIPIVTAQSGPGVLSLPAVQRQQGWEEIGELGYRMAGIQAQLQAQQDDLDLFRSLTHTESELQQWKLSLTADTDYETQGERFTQAANEIKHRKMETLRPHVAAVYQSRAERMIAEIGIHVQTDATKRIVERQHMETVDLGEASAARWARADTDQQRNEITQEYTDLVNRSTFTPKEKHRLIEQFDGQAKQQLSVLVKERIENNAEGEHQVLLSGRYDSLLDKHQVVELRNIAKRQIRENEEEARRVKAEQQEQAEMTLFDAYRAGTLTSSGIAKSALPPHKQLFWENALENKREKPFRESDLGVYAKTLKTILQHPDQITPDTLLSKMGKGLSIEHTQHAISLWQKAMEAKSLAPAQYDPLRQALTMWESMKDSYVFAPDDMLADANDVRGGAAKPGPKLKLQNDLNAQKVLDAMILRAQQGQEPRTALQELVKPYLDREAPSFFGRWSSYLFGKPADVTGDATVRQQATDFLKSHNLPPTEENTRRTMEFLKKKGVK